MGYSSKMGYSSEFADRLPRAPDRRLNHRESHTRFIVLRDGLLDNRKLAPLDSSF
jgi:hypothetical protein